MVAQTIRMGANLVKIFEYGIYIDTIPTAALDTANQVYDMGNDMASNLRYILDFHIKSDLYIGEWDWKWSKYI